MIVLEWVEMSPCGFTLVSDVTKLVDMEPVQAWGQTRDGSAEAEMEEYLKSSELSYNSILIFTEMSGRCPALF